MFKKTIFGSVVILLVFCAIGYTLPADYEAKRSIDINAPIEVVFDNVNTIAKHQAWSPWIGQDPSMNITYNDIPAGAGARYDWGSQASGKGAAVITKSDGPTSLEMEIDFGEEGTAKSFWRFEQVGPVVRATWGIKGSATVNPLTRYVGIMLDRMIGAHFETGLSRLKKESETT